jgi:hypothetical protein
MARKAKMPKLTEEHKKRLEQRFQQVRDKTLRQLYDQAHCEDLQIKAVAQARLQLQIQLRERRKEIFILKQERDAHKVKGSTDELATVKKRLKHAQIAMAMQVRMLVEGVTDHTAAKARRKWAKRAYTLEEILDDPDLDKRTEFGANYDSLLNIIASEEKHDGVSFVEDLGDITSDLENAQLEGGGSTMTLEDRTTQAPTPTAIWTQHALHIQERCRHAKLPDFAIETKLAYQKKLFDQHVDRERQLHKAVESTLNPNIANVQQPQDRKGVSTTWNSVLVTTTFSEHSLWELTSPMLWRYFEGGLSWDYPLWVPHGVMRIQTASKSSFIYFDFGARTFSTQRLFIPATISTRTLIFPAQCHQTGASVEVEVVFLASGFIKVSFPVLTVIQPDLGCKDLPVALMELTGLWLGPVE